MNVAQLAGNRAELEAAVHEALKTERDYLGDLINDYNTYFGKLVDLANAEQQLIDETEHCALYIDQRVLWIASTTPIGVDDVRLAGDGLWWLAGPEAWLGVGRTLAADAVRNPALSELGVGVFLAWIVLAAANSGPHPEDWREVVAGELLPLRADAGNRRC